MLLPHTDLAGAAHLGERVVEAVAALRIPHEGSLPDRVVTVSVGVASSHCHAGGACTLASPAALVRAADQALYAAKAAGRGRSCTYTPSISGPGAGPDA